MNHTARTIACAFAAVVLAAIAPMTAQAAGEVFVHRGWKGYVVPAGEPLDGCRMTNRIKRNLHALVHVTAGGAFWVGFVDNAGHIRPGRGFNGYAEFDGEYFPLAGSADNPSVVTMSSTAPGLERAFREARRMYLSWNGGWISMGLQGSDRATTLLRRCAMRFSPGAPPVTSYAPAPRSPGTLLGATDLPGNDYMFVDRLSRDACVNSCRADPTCRAITYNENKGRCFFKHSIGRTLRFYGATSWVK